MRFTAMADPTPDVLKPGDSLEVLRVDAGVVAAEVVDVQTVGNRSDMELIAQAVCDRQLSPGSMELAVSLPRECPGPSPAARAYLDLRPKASLERHATPASSSSSEGVGGTRLTGITISPIGDSTFARCIQW